jgi:DNA polymerase I-like protein with 3'-5' exonuclease and polymerase domains
MIISKFKELNDLTKRLSEYDGWVNLDIETQSPKLSGQLDALSALEGTLAGLESLSVTSYDKILNESKIKEIKKEISAKIREISSNKDALQFWVGYVALIQVSFAGNVYIIEAHKFKKEQIVPFLNAIKNICGQNLKFDLNFLRHHYGVEFSTVDKKIHDTFITEALIICGDTDCGWAESFSEQIAKGARRKALSLESILKRYFDIELDKSLQKATDWHNLTEEVIKYCENDVIYLDGVRNVQLELIEKLGLQHTYKLEMALLPALVKMETNGCPIDLKKLKDLHAIYQKTLETAFLDCILETNNGFNFTSPKEIVSYYLGRGLFIEKADSETLKKIDDNISSSILNYRAIQKLFSTYLDPWLNKSVRVTDDIGLLYASFNQLLTSTGRLSCDNPNLLNVPSTVNLRELFIALPEWTLAGGDLSQVEIRIGAEFSLDPLLINALKDDLDTHQFVADMTGQTRKVAKALNLAVLYNKTAYGISKDFGITLEEGEAMLNKLYASFPTIKDYQTGAVSEARNTFMVRTKGGRLRWLKHINSSDMKIAGKARNAAINSKIQGTAADGMKRTLATINYFIDKHKLDDKIKIILTVHDEVIVMIKGTPTQKQLDWFRDMLIHGTQYYCPHVPIKVGDKSNGFNVKVLEHWGQMK